MSTTWVVSACCQQPVTLAHPDQGALTAAVVCTGCGRCAGTPGVEDSPDVGRYLMFVAWVSAGLDAPLFGAGTGRPLGILGVAS